MKAETPKEFGEELRRERELREVSLEQLSAATKVSVRQIEALEAGRFDLLPARVFACGFVKALAAHLGLDPERAGSAFNHVHEAWAVVDAERRNERSTTISTRLSRPRRTVSLNTTALGLGVAAVLALLTGAAALVKSRSQERKAAVARKPGFVAQREPATGPASLSLPPQIAASAVPLPAATAAPATVVESPVASPVPAGDLKLALVFREDCWTEVNVDGKLELAELCRRGTSREFAGGHRFVLTLGNAGGVGVTLNGKAIQNLGQTGQVVRNLVLDAESRGSARPNG